MQHLEVSGAVQPIYGSLGAKGLRVAVGIEFQQKAVMKATLLKL
jgi:hypothetical protein